MKTQVTASDFTKAFHDMNRADNFSYEGLQALFNFLEQMEEDTGEESELDVIALCCDFNEDTLEDVISSYSIDVSNAEGDEDEQADIVEDYLNENTMLVSHLDNGSFVYQAF
tara:strand:+ start:87004 stop:87339 length:336 start_codon:yes stop_codon:yes gene_type:complete